MLMILFSCVSVTARSLYQWSALAAVFRDFDFVIVSVGSLFDHSSELDTPTALI